MILSSFRNIKRERRKRKERERRARGKDEALELSKTRKEGGEKRQGKDVRRDRNLGRRKYSDRGQIEMWERDLYEVIHIIPSRTLHALCHAILFKFLEKGLSSKSWSFLLFGILPKSVHQIAQIKFKNCKVFIVSEGAHPPPPLRHPFPNKEDL